MAKRKRNSRKKSKSGKTPSRPQPPVTAQELHQDLQQLIAQVDKTETLTAMVTLVLTALRKIGVKLIRMVLEQRDDQLHRRRGRGKAPCCPHCGRKLRKPRKQAVGRRTLLGRIRYWRRAWLCSHCHRSHKPLDDTLGLVALHHGQSLEFVRELALLCVLHSFDQGCELFERCFGFSVSTHLAHRLLMKLGGALYDEEQQRAEQLWQLRHEEPELFEPTPAALRKRERASRIYVMMDNSKARIQEGKRGRGAKKRTKQNGVVERFNLNVHGPVPVCEEDQDKASRGETDWRDVRALLIYREQDLAPCSKGRREILHRRVLAHLGTQEQWLQRLHMAFHDEGVYVAREVVVVADGGAGIWEAIDELLPSTSSRKVVQILDWCHAVSYLWKVAKKYKPGNKKKQVQARARWVDGLVKYLADGKVSNVLQRLRRLHKDANGELAKQLDKCLDYLEKHRGRMHYGKYRARGMTIGSGAIESVHKWVIQARFKQAGMAWSEAGLNAMLRLRCAWASRRWDDVFRPPDEEADEKPNDILSGVAA